MAGNWNFQTIFSENIKLRIKISPVSSDPEAGLFEREGPIVLLFGQESLTFQYTCMLQARTRSQQGAHAIDHGHFPGN